MGNFLQWECNERNYPWGKWRWNGSICKLTNFFFEQIRVLKRWFHHQSGHSNTRFGSLWNNKINTEIADSNLPQDKKWLTEECTVVVYLKSLLLSMQLRMQFLIKLLFKNKCIFTGTEKLDLLSKKKYLLTKIKSFLEAIIYQGYKCRQLTSSGN